MLRNFNYGSESSYYSSPPGKGFMATEDVEAVKQIYRDTQDRLADERNQLPPGFPEELSKDLLFRLRSMVKMPIASFQRQPSKSEEEADSPQPSPAASQP
jgi:hypothetical protein